MSDAVNSLTGNPKPGDQVKTLHLKRAVYGVVLTTKGRHAVIEGCEQPGKPVRRLIVHFENLAIESRYEGKAE